MENLLIEQPIWWSAWGRLRQSRAVQAALFMVWSLSLLPAPAYASQTLADEWSPQKVISLLAERSTAQGADVYEVLVVARCESEFSFMPWRSDGTLRRGGLGEVGVGQWLPPVEQNHWGRTPHYKTFGYNILAAYQADDPDAIRWDVDALAWSMGPGAPSSFKEGWTCWRQRGTWWILQP
jgi:hypothetical protein